VGREEVVVWPAARRSLSEADWTGIDAALASGRAAKSEREEYLDILTRMVELTRGAGGQAAKWR
jgi:hypothetical protein